MAAAACTTFMLSLFIDLQSMAKLQIYTDNYVKAYMLFVDLIGSGLDYLLI